MKRAAIALLFVGCSSYDVSRSLGARCERDTQCDERCLSTGPWPDGFCTTSCDTDRDCPTGSACIAEEGGVCAFTCGADPGCTFLGSAYGCKAMDDQGSSGTQVMVCRGT